MLSFFPRGVLDGILNLIESVSRGFPSYSCIRSGISWFSCLVTFAPVFQCYYFYEPCLFYLSSNLDFYVSKMMQL